MAWRTSAGGKAKNQWPEWVWQGSQSLGKSAELLAGQLTAGGYGAPISWNNDGGAIQDNPSRHDYNLDEMVDSFIKSAESLAGQVRAFKLTVAVATRPLHITHILCYRTERRALGTPAVAVWLRFPVPKRRPLVPQPRQDHSLRELQRVAPQWLCRCDVRSSYNIYARDICM